MTDLVNIVVLRARAGKSVLLGQALEELLTHTRQESGCVLSELHQSRQDPNSWMVYERWKGDDALASHMQQPYVAVFLERMGGLVSQAPDVQPFDHRQGGAR
jgi:quinol monooxygenase YgiN